MLLCVSVSLLLLAIPSTAMMPGGWKEQDASDTEYLDRAWKAMKGINDDASNGGPYHMIPIKVLSARTQVVAGVKHEFDVVVGESNCKKGDMLAVELTKENCQLKDDHSRAIYKVTLWEKPWENFEQFDVVKVRNLEKDEQV